MAFEEHVLDRVGYIHAFPIDIDGDGTSIPPCLPRVEEVVLFRGDGQGLFKDVLFRVSNHASACLDCASRFRW